MIFRDLSQVSYKYYYRYVNFSARTLMLHKWKHTRNKHETFCVYWSMNDNETIHKHFTLY